MNSPITFPPQAPALKLARPPAEKWAVTLAEERRRLQEDLEALREREANLREYEARLRALQSEIESGRSAALAPAPGHSASGLPAGGRTASSPLTSLGRSASRAPFEDAALQAAWEKLHRAREILEAEQNHLRDDRIAVREHEQAVKRREQAVAVREAQLAEREALVRAAVPPTAAEVAEVDEESAVSRLTTAPFKIARAVLRGKK
jgi:DNA repair exonuclease SbcCD ATPase subunit